MSKNRPKKKWWIKNRVSIVCDDGASYWSDHKFAMDAGHSVIRVNHGTSQELGMITMTEYINCLLEPIKAQYLPNKFEVKIFMQ